MDKPNPVAANTSSLPEKNSSNVPVTTAVAPVVEKSVPEKSASPLEGKENIPVMNLSESNMSQTRTEDSDEPIEVPYKPPTPEIIDLDAEPEPSSVMISGSNNMLYDVKKRKLDILKEGGLEVTAITALSDPMSREGRPSVIQHPVPPSGVPKSEMGNLSITVTSDARRMPPPVPVSRSQSPKKNLLFAPYARHPIQTPEVPSHRRAAIDVRLVGNSKFPPSNSGKPTVNGNAPPKVLQSRSIYSYSERTVYGNPKDPFMPPPHSSQVPRHLVRTPATKPTGGEVLDLTVKGPQKPIVEIMRVPTVPLSTRLQPPPPPPPVREHSVKNFLKNSVPHIDARVGSNLEITLVSGSKNAQKLPPPAPKMQLMNNNNHHHQQQHPHHQRPPQKRSSSGKLVPNSNNHKPYENGSSYGHAQTLAHGNKSGGGLVIPSPHSMAATNNRADLTKSVDSGLKHSVPLTASSTSPFAAPMYPSYLSQLSAAAAKNMPAPYLPMLDPMYYTALCSQGMYPPGPLAAAPPMFPPMPTMDQLQLYKDLMAHSARGRFFPPPQEGNMSITSVGQPDNLNTKK